MKESNFTAMTPRPKTPDFIKSTFKSLRKKIVPAKKTVIRASKNSDHKTGAATNRVAFAAAPFPTPIPKKRNGNQRDYFFSLFSANFITDYKP